MTTWQGVTNVEVHKQIIFFEKEKKRKDNKRSMKKSNHDVC